MKKLFLIACLASSMHSARGMDGAIYGAVIPAIGGLCYAVGGSVPVDQKLTQWVTITAGGAALGGLSQLVFYAAFSNPATAAATTAFAAATISCGITGVWALEKIVPRMR
jgi:hypothetical protein